VGFKTIGQVKEDEERGEEPPICGWCNNNNRVIAGT
jgi:hypothetical protein